MKRSLYLLVIVTILLPCRSFALFGVGDIVFDPTAFVQLVQTYGNEVSQLEQLGSMVGLNTQQLGTLNAINSAVGVVSGNVSPNTITGNQLAALSQGLGIDANGALSTVFQNSGPFAGALDVFMGMNMDTFRNTQSAPWHALETWAVNQSLGELGASVGLNSNEVAFTEHIASMDPATRQHSQSQISTGLAKLALNRYAQANEQRRLAIQAQANMSQQAATRASNSTTLNETAAAGTQVAATGVQMHATAAQHQNEANEVLIQQGDATNDVLNDMDDMRAREAADSRMEHRLNP